MRSVSLLPALLADPTIVTDAKTTYGRSVALEATADIAEQRTTSLGHIDAQLTDELRTFLTSSQTGARAVARCLVDRILRVRQGQLSKVATEAIRTERLGPIFPDLPGDQGHFPEPYLPLMLRGLVNTPPSYVVSMLAGQPLGQPPAPNVEGVALVQLLQVGRLFDSPTEMRPILLANPGSANTALPCKFGPLLRGGGRILDRASRILAGGDRRRP